MTGEIPPEWRIPIDEWIAWMGSGGASEETMFLRDYQICRLAADRRDTSPFDLEPGDLATWLASHSWGRETLRSYSSAVRRFYGWAHAAGHIRTDPSRLLPTVRRGAPAPKPAPEQLIDAALAAADNRTWLLLMLGSRHGLRRGEMAQIHSKDLMSDITGFSLVVHGKGGKLRVVPLTDDVARHIRNAPFGWLFPSPRGGHLTPAHIGVLLKRALAGQASAHQLRHRFASQGYRRTRDLRAIQEVLGHASVATTQLYIDINQDELRTLVEAVH